MLADEIALLYSRKLLEYAHMPARISKRYELLIWGDNISEPADLNYGRLFY